jgi:hypothetical protein
MDDKYIKGETLGAGTFASVIKATVKEVSTHLRRFNSAHREITPSNDTKRGNPLKSSRPMETACRLVNRWL